MNFECRICGFEGNSQRKDTYHFCPNCTVIFLNPEKFTEKYEDNEELEFFEKTLEEDEIQ